MKLTNKSGQVVVESILLMFVALAVFVFVTKTIRQQQLLSNMVNGPWTQLTGMIEDGVWGPSAQKHINHPNYLRRHISLLGDSE